MVKISGSGGGDSGTLQRDVIVGIFVFPPVTYMAAELRGRESQFLVVLKLSSTRGNNHTCSLLGWSSREMLKGKSVPRPEGQF